MTIRCLLVDDEPIALDILRTYVRQLPVLELAGCCQSAVEAFSVLQTQAVDLLLLDIQMPQLSGLALLRTLPNPPKTIITSAHREYALDGYELNVVDYLVKPVAFERFVRAVGKVISTPLATMPVAAPSREDPFLFVREDRRLVRIDLPDIISLESLRDYVRIKTTTQEIVTRQTIGYYEELLPADLFLRVHRSFMVAVSKIRAMTDNQIEVPGQMLPIGRYYKQQVFDRLQRQNLTN
jgi:DNA-binding LytR/AlgR family response regulator